MNFRQRHPQVRVCSVCGLAGHNKSRCRSQAPLPSEPKIVTPKSTYQPVQFFVHHVSDSPALSPHLVNLKNNKINAWDKINTASPAAHQSLYHQYHNSKSVPTAIPKSGVSEWAHLCQTPLNQENEKTSKQKIENNQPAQLRINQTKKIKSNFNFLPSLSRVKETMTDGVRGATRAFTGTGFQRLAFAVAILLIVVITPLQANSYYQNLKLSAGSIAQSGTTGFMALKDSTASLLSADLVGAQNSLSVALENLNQAVSELQNKHQTLVTFASILPIIGPKISSRQNLLLAGEEIALGNLYLIKGITAGQQTNNSLTARLQSFTNQATQAVPKYEKALYYLSLVSARDLPDQYQGEFENIKLLFTAATADLSHLSSLGASLQDIFGGEGRRRYLLVFQNEHELRPTGGFIGSFAVIDVKDGQIVNWDVPKGGSYDLKGQLYDNILPPEPLLLANKRWEFQDANWFPDFPSSAQKLMWFYHKSRGITLDGVVAVNSSVLERLLAITGPVNDDKRNITISADSAINTIQQVVETGPEKKINQPKQIIGELAGQFIERFRSLPTDQILPLLLSLDEALQQKEIQAYFTNNDIQTKIVEMGWGGKILATNASQDYLMVVNTNIQGQKSDALITQNINHQAVIDSDGSIVNTVVITRSHSGNAADQFGNVPNIDYLRVYVPAGSELISASGFSWPSDGQFKVPSSQAVPDINLTDVEKENKIDNRSGTRITNEFNKTAFGNWIITEPGLTNTVQFTYRLPFKITTQPASTIDRLAQYLGSHQIIGGYQLLVQRQSGINSDFESQVIYPSQWQTIWQDGPGIKAALNGFSIPKLSLTQDTIWSVALSTR